MRLPINLFFTSKKHIKENFPVGTIFTIDNDYRVPKDQKFIVKKHNEDGTIDIQILNK